ncbi:hypothetical protein [Paenibacillus jiagnxiensis]|uniref:hypothetical protein n=1 Tax=Paenibacillus jiagnxiensis TaxID=3228926 RepID=UPI0033A0EBD8
MSESQHEYKIPRNVKARFELFGLTGPRFLIWLPFLAVAFIVFKLISGPPSIVIPLVLAGLSYWCITYEIEGETVLETIQNRIKDSFTPRIHLWEENNHVRFYEEEK